MKENLQNESRKKQGRIFQRIDKVSTNRNKRGIYQEKCEYSISALPGTVNAMLIFAILRRKTIIINETFMVSINSVQILPLRYTPSTRRCCIAGKRGWIRRRSVDRLI
jgi:hypothetical protein